MSDAQAVGEGYVRGREMRERSRRVDARELEEI